MVKLESVLERLTNTVELLADRIKKPSKPYHLETGYSMDIDSREASSATSDAGHRGHEKEGFAHSREGVASADGTGDGGSNLPRMTGYALYIGTQSIFSIFSRDSLDWMEQKLGPRGAECITPLKNTLVVCHNKLSTF